MNYKEEGMYTSAEVTEIVTRAVFCHRFGQIMDHAIDFHTIHGRFPEEEERALPG